jgi:hypothetical protein
MVSAKPATIRMSCSTQIMVMPIPDPGLNREKITAHPPNPCDS